MGSWEWVNGGLVVRKPQEYTGVGGEMPSTWEKGGEIFRFEEVWSGALEAASEALETKTCSD
jgi:hypothetical protein